MDIDEHTHTIEQFQHDTDERLAELLPGYIRRHRAEIIRNVQQASNHRYPYERDVVTWGAMKALDELGKVGIAKSTETP